MRRERVRSGRRTDSSAGFTVAELVAASAILFVVLVGVLGAVQFAGAGTRMTAMRQTAINIATQQVENDRNLPYGSLGVGANGNPAGTVPAVQTQTTAQGTFTITTTIRWVLDRASNPPRASYKSVKIVVAWSDPSPGGSVSVSTNVFGQGTNSNLGDVLAHVQDIEGGLPVPGVTITMDQFSGANIMASSSDEGEVLWHDVSLGQATFPSGSSPSYLVDTGALKISGATIHAGFQDVGFIDVQKPRSLAIHVKSDSLPDLPGATVTLKDTGLHPATFTAVTDGNGWAHFDGTTLGQPGLWLDTYQVSAALLSSKSDVKTLQLSPGCPIANVGPELTVTNPPSIIVSMVVAGTSTPLSTQPMVVSVTDPSGSTLAGSGQTYTGTATFPTTTTGNYKVTISGVNGFLTTTNYVFAGTATGVGQSCVVPMTPYFNVFVNLDTTSSPTPMYRVPVTVANHSTGTEVNSLAGVSPGITASDGTVGFLIPANASYDVEATVNGRTYNGTPNPVPLSVTSPLLTPYEIAIRAGVISVTLKTGFWSSRYVLIYNSNNDLVTYVKVLKASPKASFTLPPGMYTVTVGSTSLAVPQTLPAASGSYKNYPLTSPGLDSDTTISKTNLL